MDRRAHPYLAHLIGRGVAAAARSQGARRRYHRRNLPALSVALGRGLARSGGIIRVNPPVRETPQPGTAVVGAGRRHHRSDRDRSCAAHAGREDPKRHLGGGLRISRRRDADAADADRGQPRPHVRSATMSAELVQPGEESGGFIPRKGAIRRVRRGHGDRRPVPPRIIDDARLQSRSKISPWNGRRIKGLPIHTIVRGRFVMKDRALADSMRGWGRPCMPSSTCRRRSRSNTDQTMRRSSATAAAAQRSEAMTPAARERNATPTISSSSKA